MKSFKVDLPTFDDKIDYQIPTKCGIYFLGDVHINPITNEIFYWVKVGKGKNLANRMKMYNCHSTMIWRIDFWSVDEDDLTEIEEDLQKALIKYALAKHSHNDEWYLVNRETYLAMCKQGLEFLCEDD